uniref:GH3 n=1 Tax=Arundo donax TaxID=35708 RepID=A0A0A9ARD0_ARUDO
MRPRRRHRPSHLPRQGADGDVRGPAAVHPAHCRRRPFAHPVRAPRLRVPHQLRHVGRRAQADAHHRGRAQPPSAAVQPPDASHEPVCPWA